MSMLNQTLSKNAQKVQDVLSQFNLTLEVVELSASTRTANEAAATIGCEVAQIIKSIVFRATLTNRAILVLASGSNRIDEKVLAKEIKEEIVKADADYIKEVTGFVIGGIPPIGHKQVLDTYIDEDLLQFNELWAAAGTPNAVFRLQARDLVKLTNGKIVSIK